MSTSTFAKKIATKITGLGLAVPAIFLLEAHKPLAFLGSQFLLVGQPTLDIFLPSNLIRNTADLLSDPDKLEDLIAEIERHRALATSAKGHSTIRDEN